MYHKHPLLSILLLLSSFTICAQQSGNIRQTADESAALDYLIIAKSFYGKSTEKAIDYSSQALQNALKTNNDSLKGQCYKASGVAYYYAGKPDKALPRFDTAMVFFKKINDRVEISNTYNNLGITYASLGDYNKAIEVYISALKLNYESGDSLRVGHLNNNIGALYYELESYNEALSYFKSSYEISFQVDDSSTMMSALNNWGLVEKDLKNYDAALAVFRRSVELGKHNNDLIGTANSLHNIGMVHYFLNNTDSAYLYYTQAAEIYDKTGMVIGNNYLGLGNIYFDKGDYEKALQQFNKALEISYHTNDKLLRLDALRNLYETWRKTGQTGEAFSAVEHYHGLFDSIKSLFDSTAVQNMQAKFGINEKIREVDVLMKEQAAHKKLLQEQKKQLNLQKTLLFGSFLFLAIVFTLSVLLHKLNKKIRHKNDDLHLKNTALAEAKAELSKSHQTLVEQEELLRTLINATPDIICFKNGKGQWLQANEAQISLYKLQGVDYKLKTDRELIGHNPDQQESLAANILSDEITWQKGIITRSDEQIELSDGNILIFDIIKVPLFNPDDSRKGLIVWGRDISDRKRTEKKLEFALKKAEESDRLKTAFLSNMSHEIRTPLNAIIGFSDLLDEDDLSRDEKNKFIKLIHENGNTLLNLIGDIIDLARIEAGETKLQLNKCNINTLFTELHETYLGLLRKRSITQVSISLSIPEKSVTMLADQYKLKQILTNLIDNALKFTEKGEILFGFVVNENQNQEIETIQIFVKDTGIGIPEDKQGLVFDRFIKLNDGGKKLYPGTGLGLSIVNQFVQLMKGNIRIESKANEGTSFIVTLPFSYQWADAKNARISRKNHDYTGKSLLVVEDVDSNFELLKILLEPTGAQVLRASNGLAAIEMSQNNPQISLVLMDIQLPGLNGYEATTKIKAIRPDLPIIAQTAFAMSEEKNACFAAGCDAYLAKPIRSELLLPVIDELIIHEH